MKKKYLIEIIILAILIVAEAITLIVVYPEALQAQNTDAYMSALLTLFVNIDVLYGIVLLIFNVDWRKK